MDFSPIVTIDGLVQVFRLVEQPDNRMDFSEWLQNSYFTAAGSTISNEAARRFFGPTIRAAEIEYQENFSALEEVLGEKLSLGYLDDIPLLDRPEVVDSLRAKAAYLAAVEARSITALQSQLKELNVEKEKATKAIRYWRLMARRAQAEAETRLGRKRASRKKRNRRG